MSFQRLRSQLRREIKASPKKAAVLGTLVVVALYFWGPLVWGLIRGQDGEETASAKEEAVASSPNAELSPRKKGTPKRSVRQADREKLPAWDQLMAWIEQDPRTIPASDRRIARDPFTLSSEERARRAAREAMERMAAQAAVVAAGKADAPKEQLSRSQGEGDTSAITPQSLELALTATLIGPRGKTAVIDGRAYRIDEKIEKAKDGQPVVFTLVEIRPRRVLLERQGQQFELTIPEVTTTGRIGRLGSPH